MENVISESNLYKEWIELPEEIMEPEKFNDCIPVEFLSLSSFCDPYIDSFTILGKDKRGHEKEYVKEGFKILHKDFWLLWKELKLIPKHKFGVSLSIDDNWYFVSTLRRK